MTGVKTGPHATAFSAGHPAHPGIFRIFFRKIRAPAGNREKNIPDRTGIIPYEWLLRGRRRHRSGSRHTCPCRLLPCRSPWQLPMRGIRSRRFRIRYTYRCQRPLPTRSLRSICFFYWKKRVTIESCFLWVRRAENCHHRDEFHVLPIGKNERNNPS